MVIGFVWYSNLLFAKPWMRLTGMKMEDMKSGPGVGYLLTFLGAIVESYVLTHFLAYVNATTLSSGAATGLWLAIGFIIPAFGADFIFNQKPRQLYWITVGYHAATLVAMGALLAAWH